MPGLGEILFIVLLVAIVFFGERAGALGDAIGRFRRELKRGQAEDDRIEVRSAAPDEPKRPE